MNVTPILAAPRMLLGLAAVQALSLSLLAQTPTPASNSRPAAGRTPSSFAPAQPGGKVVYRPAGNNVIEVASKPGAPTLADKAIAARTAQQRSLQGAGAVRPASTTRVMQEVIPTPAGEKSVIVPSQGSQTLEEIPPGAQIIQEGGWIDSGSGQVIGDHYDQPFFSNEGGVVMNDGLPAEGCADCGCSGGYTGYRDGMRILRPCADGCLIPCPRISIDNTQVFAGASAYTGIANRGETGSFGFHEGANLGGPFPFLPVLDLSMQLGVMGTQSNQNGASFTSSSRDQLFTTLGLFHRVDWGFQGGVVVDYMHDEWYYNLDIYQIRGELSWVNPEGHELGFWFTTGDNLRVTSSTIQVNNQNVTFDQTWEVTDIYAFFYRRRFCETNAVVRGYGGFTENGDGIAGADATVPLNDYFSLSGAFTYLIPNNDTTATGLPSNSREGWNVQISLVWFPGAGARQWTYHRPLLDVANNGTFFLQNP